MTVLVSGLGYTPILGGSIKAEWKKTAVGGLLRTQRSPTRPLTMIQAMFRKPMVLWYAGSMHPTEWLTVTVETWTLTTSSETRKHGVFTLDFPQAIHLLWKTRIILFLKTMNTGLKSPRSNDKMGMRRKGKLVS